jgi:putative copper resistance protein D
VLEPAVIALRLVQYVGAMILFGSSLFLIYGLPSSGPASAADLKWPRRALAQSAGALAIASLLGMLAQTSILAGSITEGFKPASLSAVITTMALGPSSLVRAGAAAIALALLTFCRPGRGLWIACALLGAIACGSFAWMGHGAATNGPAGLLHLLADILHLLAAAVWIGALAMFLGLLSAKGAHRDGADRALHRALQGFSGLGSAIVATLVLTGVVNSWFLVGPSRLSGLWTTLYGQLLSIKLFLFAAMVVLAAINRFRSTPALGRALDRRVTPTIELAALRRSVLLETAAAMVVLFLVAWLGALEPISAL